MPTISEKTALVEYEKILMKRTTLFASGEIKNQFLTKFWSRYSIYQKDNQKILHLLILASNTLLCEYVLNNKNTMIAWIQTEKIQSMSNTDKIKALSFYLSHPHIQDEEFYFWELNDIEEHLSNPPSLSQTLELILNSRQEKSIKRLFYKQYLATFPSKYDPKFDYLVMRVFEDTNLLSRLLEIPPFYKREIFIRLSLLQVERALSFILEFFTQKQLFNLIISAVGSREDFQYFKDIIVMVSNENTLNIFLEHFTKDRANITIIHNTLVRIQNAFIVPMQNRLYEESLEVAFEYEEVYLSAASKEDDLKFILPSTPKVLFKWAQILHNCMASYSNSIRGKQLVIFAIFRGSKLLYAIELKGFKMLQAKAVYNKAIPSEDMKTIHRWLARWKKESLKLQ